MKNFFETHTKDIVAIGKKHDVDAGVALDMFKQDLVTGKQHYSAGVMALAAFQAACVAFKRVDAEEIDALDKEWLAAHGKGV